MTSRLLTDNGVDRILTDSLDFLLIDPTDIFVDTRSVDDNTGNIVVSPLIIGEFLAKITNTAATIRLLKDDGFLILTDAGDAIIADSHGNPLLDSFGNPITDQSGNVLFGEFVDGSPIELLDDQRFDLPLVIMEKLSGVKGDNATLLGKDSTEVADAVRNVEVLSLLIRDTRLIDDTTRDVVASDFVINMEELITIAAGGGAPLEFKGTLLSNYGFVAEFLMLVNSDGVFTLEVPGTSKNDGVVSVEQLSSLQASRPFIVEVLMSAFLDQPTGVETIGSIVAGDPLLIGSLGTSGYDSVSLVEWFGNVGQAWSSPVEVIGSVRVDKASPVDVAALLIADEPMSVSTVAQLVRDSLFSVETLSTLQSSLVSSFPVEALGSISLVRSFELEEGFDVRRDSPALVEALVRVVLDSPIPHQTTANLSQITTLSMEFAGQLQLSGIHFEVEHTVDVKADSLIWISTIRMLPYGQILKNASKRVRTLGG